jgi:hypothetical protein
MQAETASKIVAAPQSLGRLGEQVPVEISTLIIEVSGA